MCSENLSDGGRGSQTQRKGTTASAPEPALGPWQRGRQVGSEAQNARRGLPVTGGITVRPGESAGTRAARRLLCCFWLCYLVPSSICQRSPQGWAGCSEPGRLSSGGGRRSWGCTGGSVRRSNLCPLREAPGSVRLFRGRRRGVGSHRRAWRTPAQGLGSLFFCFSTLPPPPRR